MPYETIPIPPHRYRGLFRGIVLAVRALGDLECAAEGEQLAAGSRVGPATFLTEVHLRAARVSFTRRNNYWTNRFRKFAADARRVNAGSAIMDERADSSPTSRKSRRIQSIQYRQRSIGIRMNVNPCAFHLVGVRFF